MATLRELITRWKFKTDSKPIAALRRGLTGLKSAAGFVAKGLGVAAAAAAGAALAIWKLVRSTADESDQLMKLSKRVAVSFEALQKFKFAAELSGATIDDVGLAFKRLAANAYDASRGLKESEDAFKDVGVEIKDENGQLKDNETLLKESLIGLSLMEDKTKRVALAQKLFGKSGLALLPMLEGGAFGVAEMMKEAEKLGLVLDEKAGKAAEKFNDDLLRVKRQVQGVGARFGSALLPMLNKYISRTSVWLDSNRKVIDQNMGAVVTGLSDAFKELTSDMKPGDFQNLGVEIKDALVTVATALKWLGKISKVAWQIITLPFRMAGSVIGAVGDVLWTLGEQFAKVFGGATVNVNDLASLIRSVLMAPWNLVSAAARAAFEVVAGVIDKFFPGFKAKAVEVFDGVVNWFKALPSVIWKGLVDGFRSAIMAVLAQLNAFKGKLGKVGDLLFGKGKISIPQALQPAPAAAGGGGAVGGSTVVNQTNNITTPPGTPATVAARIGDSVKTATTRDLRRAQTDVARR